MEEFIVIVIAILAGGYIVRDFHGKYKAARSGDCQGACSSCVGNENINGSCPGEGSSRSDTR